MNENGLSRMQLSGVHQRLPCGQCAHRHRCGLGKVERFWFRGHFPLLDRDVLRPATSEGWVTVNCITRFKVCYFRARFLHDPSDVVRFTVGEMDVVPNAMAVIPESVTFTIDFRHPDPETLRSLGNQIPVVARENAGKCEVTVSELRHSSPVIFKGPVPEAILKAVERLVYSFMALPSGAGHDARYIAELAPAGMIFIPCWRGISHNEAESAELQDMVAGTRVLAHTLVELANL